MKTHWEEMNFNYPEFSLRLRRDVVEWIDSKGGKKFIKKLIYRLYNKVVARAIIRARRTEHKKQFKELRRGDKDERST